MNNIRRRPTTLKHADSLPITVEREHGGEGWIVLHDDHGWLLGSFEAALNESARLVAIEWGRR